MEYNSIWSFPNSQATFSADKRSMKINLVFVIKIIEKLCCLKLIPLTDVKSWKVLNRCTILFSNIPGSGAFRARPKPNTLWLFPNVWERRSSSVDSSQVLHLVSKLQIENIAFGSLSPTDWFHFYISLFSMSLFFTLIHLHFPA